ncbi:hypothetical protein WJX81_001397 [Elliptochloris bilobata]|uniref:Uncharacterized protein n=1 Tax=Elliptochloris bilobata TaxID=381761 RepID=A0AAW1SDU9_9CHLO
MYGEWSLEDSDVREVWGYRNGLSVAAAALLLETATAFLPETGAARELARGLQTPVALAGGAGLGASLVLIHIYVAPIKRFLQALWALGFCGGLYLAATQAQPLPEYVASHPSAVWLVGPFFAAVTGVAFKEGMCYGKAECAALFFVTPALLLGHLTGLMPPEAERALLVAFTALALVFAARKYTQAVKDDIGDKSVFTFLALPPEEQERRVAELSAQASSVRARE